MPPQRAMRPRMLFYPAHVGPSLILGALRDLLLSLLHFLGLFGPRRIAVGLAADEGVRPPAGVFPVSVCSVHSVVPKSRRVPREFSLLRGIRGTRKRAPYGEDSRFRAEASEGKKQRPAG